MSWNIFSFGVITLHQTMLRYRSVCFSNIYTFPFKATRGAQTFTLRLLQPTPDSSSKIRRFFCHPNYGV